MSKRTNYTGKTVTRMSITLPDSTLKKIKYICVKEDVSTSAIISNLIQRYIDNYLNHHPDLEMIFQDFEEE